MGSPNTPGFRLARALGLGILLAVLGVSAVLLIMLAVVYANPTLRVLFLILGSLALLVVGFASVAARRNMAPARFSRFWAALTLLTATAVGPTATTVPPTPMVHVQLINEKFTESEITHILQIFAAVINQLGNAIARILPPDLLRNPAISAHLQQVIDAARSYGLATDGAAPMLAAPAPNGFSSANDIATLLQNMQDLLQDLVDRCERQEVAAATDAVAVDLDDLRAARVSLAEVLAATRRDARVAWRLRPLLATAGQRLSDDLASGVARG